MHSRQPTEMLREDHERIEELLQSCEGVDDGDYDETERLMGEIFRELEIHSAVTREVFYPILEDVSPDGAELIAETIEPDRELARIADDVRELSADDERFPDLFLLFAEALRRHIDNEEEKILSIAEEELGEKFDELGGSMAEFRDDLEAAIG